MKESKLTNIITIVFILSHFLIVVTIILFRMLNWYDDKTIKMALPIILPLFVGFTTPIVKNVIKNKYVVETSSKILNPIYVFASIFISIAFILFISTIVIRQALDPFAKEEFTFLLGLGETVFGLFIGLFIKSLFKD